MKKIFSIILMVVCSLFVMIGVSSCKHEHTVIIDEAIAATCTTTGLSEGSHCAICNEVLQEQYVIEIGEHVVTVITEAIAPTCSTEGQTVAESCSVCGEILSVSEIIPPTEHNVIIDAAVESTCLSSGLTEGSHCSI